MSKRALVIAGGGTGGHIFPGLAVAAAWRQVTGGAPVVWLGARGGPEETAVPRHGVEVVTVTASRIVGMSAPRRLLGYARIPVGFAEALAALARLRPAVVLGVGGYASVAGVLAGRVLGIPVGLHEQNALPGRTNRRLGRFARRCFVSFAESLRYFPAGRAEVTGNPVRTTLCGVPPLAIGGRAARRLLVFGGSQGAHFLNTAVPPLCAALRAAGQPVAVRHQTGPRDVAEVQALYVAGGLDARVEPFIDDMAAAYAEADFVVCRAGATTVAELAVVGRPALLVPFPFAADDHQAVNAQSLAAAGAALAVRQEAFAVADLAPRLGALLADGAALEAMAAAARTLARPDAAALVATRLLALAGRRPAAADREAEP